MFKLLKHTECYAPDYLGMQDILVAFDKIAAISPNIPSEKLYGAEVVECGGKIACPGFIDQHVHISGGGGEQGPASVLGPIGADELFRAGITTIVGLLGADAVAKSMPGLLAKARALEADGVTSFIYSGNYGLPPVTITGKLLTDIALIDKVIGAGEIAISDHRSSAPTLGELAYLAYEAHVGGMLGNKAGIVHFHVGNGKEGLGSLMELLEESDYPASMFVPTHLNRSRALFRQAMQYRSQKGNIDLTSGENTEEGMTVPECLRQLLDASGNLERVTVSSDANGSGAGPYGTETARAKTLFDDITASVREQGLPLETVLRTVTSNAAQVLKLFPSKGCLAEGSDADILLLDKSSLQLYMLFARGRLVYDGGVLPLGRTKE